MAAQHPKNRQKPLRIHAQIAAQHPENRRKSLRTRPDRGAQQLVFLLCRDKVGDVFPVTDFPEVGPDTGRGIGQERKSLRMTSAGTTEISSSVAHLKERWDTLNSLERAKEISNIKHKEGLSNRQLAIQLGHNESLLRRALKSAQAPPLDQILARTGRISENKLLRRSKEAAAELAAKKREAVELERTKAAQEGCKQICAWLEQESLAPVAGVEVVDEARRQLAHAEQYGKLPPGKAPEGTPVAEIIQRTRPAESLKAQVELVAWYAEWLALWAYYAWPEFVTRHRTLNMALNRLEKE